MIGSLKIVDIPPPPRKAMLQNIGIENAWTLYALAKREWAKRKKWKPFPHKNLFRCAYKIPIQVFNCQTSGLTQPVNWTASTTENIHIYQFCLMIILSRFLNYKNGAKSCNASQRFSWMINGNFVKVSLVRNFLNKVVRRVSSNIYRRIIKTREMFSFLPLIISSVTTRLSFLLLISSAIKSNMQIRLIFFVSYLDCTYQYCYKHLAYHSSIQESFTINKRL